MSLTECPGDACYAILRTDLAEQARSRIAPVTTTTTTTTTTRIPHTGSELAGYLLVASILILVGGSLVLFGRRRFEDASLQD